MIKVNMLQGKNSKIIMIVSALTILSIFIIVSTLCNRSHHLVKFSHNSGIYTSPIDLELSCETGAIYYTLDGSTPDRSSTLYTDAIHIMDRTDEPNVWASIAGFSDSEYYPPQEFVDKATIVRVAVYNFFGGGKTEYTQIYYIFDKEKIKKYEKLPILSLVAEPSELFDSKSGIYRANPDSREIDGFVNITNAQTIYNIPYNIYHDISSNPLQTKLRIRGNKSAVGAMKAMGFTMPNGENWSLRPTRSIFTEGILFPRLLSLGIDAPYTQPINVFLNGEYWGLYVLEPRVDERYISKHYEVDKDSISISKNKQIIYGNPSIASDYMDVRNECLTLDGTNEKDNRYIRDHFNISNFIRYYANEIYINDQDSSEIYNYVAFRENKLDGKWNYCIYDWDSTLVEPDYNSFNTEYPLRAAWMDNMLIHELIKNVEFKCCFINEMLNCINYVYDPEIMCQMVDECYAIIEPSVVNHKLRYPGYIDHDYYDTAAFDDPEEIKQFFIERPRYVLSYLQDYFGLDDPKVTIDKNGKEIYYFEEVPNTMVAENIFVDKGN